MIPQERLSTEVVLSEIQSPRDERKPPLVDLELGGVALNNPDQGLQVAEWEAYYSADQVFVKRRDDLGLGVAAMTRPGLVSFSLTFDQNMQPAVAWETGSEAGLYWFDATIPAYTDVLLPEGSRNPRCVLDDKRNLPVNTGASDILLCYIRGDELFFRAQRDRFTIEYPLGLGFADTYLEQVGMGRGLRVLFRFQGRRT